jgi:ABC-2 type transport system permease protein
MTNALRAEWTKLRTLSNTGWLLGGTVILTIGVSAAVAAAVDVTSGSAQDPTRLSLTGIYGGQTVIAVLAVLTIS